MRDTLKAYQALAGICTAKVYENDAAQEHMVVLKSNKATIPKFLLISDHIGNIQEAMRCCRVDDFKSLLMNEDIDDNPILRKTYHKEAIELGLSKMAGVIKCPKGAEAQASQHVNGHPCSRVICCRLRKT
jgi:hypothetical protein